MSYLRHTLFSAALFLVGASQAQYQFGVQAGPQYVLVQQTLKSTLPGILSPQPMNGFGFHAGVWYRSDRIHLINVRIGLEWSYRTFDQEYTYDEVDPVGKYTYTGKYTSKLQYLELPVQLSYYFWRGAHVDLGITPAYLVTGRLEDEGRSVYSFQNGTLYRPDNYSYSNKTVERYKRVELANTIALGYDFRNGLVVGMSYVRAFSRMNDSDELLQTNFYNLFRVTLGYDFIHPTHKMKLYRSNRHYKR